MDSLPSIFLVSLGAILGASLRVYIVSYAGINSIKKYHLTLLVNVTSSFFLGYLLALSSQINRIQYYNELLLFLGVGFLGGFSTFSTFIFDLFLFLKGGQFKKFFDLACLSIVFGLLLGYVGYLIGR